MGNQEGLQACQNATGSSAGSRPLKCGFAIGLSQSRSPTKLAPVAEVVLSKAATLNAFGTDQTRSARDAYRAAGGLAKLIEATARFSRFAGHPRADCGFAWPNTIVPWFCPRTTVPVFVVKVAWPLSTITP